MYRGILRIIPEQFKCSPLPIITPKQGTGSIVKLRNLAIRDWMKQWVLSLSSRTRMGLPCIVPTNRIIAGVESPDNAKCEIAMGDEESFELVSLDELPTVTTDADDDSGTEC